MTGYNHSPQRHWPKYLAFGGALFWIAFGIWYYYFGAIYVAEYLG
jgi:hypothetical protein